jgi:hypothetical protein
MVIAQATPACAAKVVEGRSRCAEPLHTKDHIESFQGNDKQVNDKFPSVDEFAGRATHAGIRDTVVIVHLDVEPGLMHWIEVKSSCDKCQDEGMSGPQINQGAKGLIHHSDGELHGVSRCEPGDHVQRDVEVVGDQLVIKQRVVIHLEEVDSFHWADLQVLP